MVNVVCRDFQRRPRCVSSSHPEDMACDIFVLFFSSLFFLLRHDYCELEFMVLFVSVVPSSGEAARLSLVFFSPPRENACLQIRENIGVSSQYAARFLRCSPAAATAAAAVNKRLLRCSCCASSRVGCDRCKDYLALSPIPRLLQYSVQD